MDDALPVTNVDFLPNRFSGQRPGTETPPQPKKPKPDSATKNRSASDPARSDHRSSADPAVGGQIDLEA